MPLQIKPFLCILQQPVSLLSDGLSAGQVWGSQGGGGAAARRAGVPVDNLGWGVVQSEHLGQGTLLVGLRCCQALSRLKKGQEPPLGMVVAPKDCLGSPGSEAFMGMDTQEVFRSSGGWSPLLWELSLVGQGQQSPQDWYLGSVQPEVWWVHGPWVPYRV